MEKVAWFGKVTLTDKLKDEIVLILEARRETYPEMTFTDEALIIRGWTENEQELPFELKFNFTYGKGVVQCDGSKRGTEWFETIVYILRIINRRSPDLDMTSGSQIDFDSGFACFKY